MKKIKIIYSEEDQEKMDYWDKVLTDYLRALRLYLIKTGVKRSQVDKLVRSDEGFQKILEANTKIHSVCIPIRVELIGDPDEKN